MTHLYIELNTGLTEEVNSSIISKLYELAISGDLDNTSDLKGRLHSSTAKDVHVTYLNENFDDLYITADKLYVTFTDPEVERVLMATGHIGDGLGISLSDCATYGNYNNHTAQFEIFKNNSTIEYFPEFKYFTYWINRGGQNWFAGCTNLKNIDITGCTNIAYSAFSGCSLSEFNVQQLSSVQTIGLFCFLNSGISGEINLPSLQNIYANAFNNCTGITKVSSLGSITELRNYTFSKCSNITQVELPTTCTNIGNSVFLDCNHLTTIDLSNVTQVGFRAFENCTSLTSLGATTFPGLTSLRAACFRNCTNLTGELNFPDLTNFPYENGYRGGLFYNCKKLTKITLGHITLLDYGAPSLTAGHAFEGCSALLTLDLGDSLTAINNHLFSGCDALRSVIIRATTPPTCTGASEGIARFFGNENVKIYVPDTVVNDYKAASGWSNFASYIYPLSEYLS